MDVTVNRSRGGSDLYQVGDAIVDPATYSTTSAVRTLIELENSDVAPGEWITIVYNLNQAVIGTGFNFRDLNSVLTGKATDLYFGFYMNGTPVSLTLPGAMSPVDGAHTFVSNDDPFGTPGTELNWYHATSSPTAQTVFTLPKNQLDINQVVVYVHDADDSLPAFGGSGTAADHGTSTVFRNTVNGEVDVQSTSFFNAPTYSLPVELSSPVPEPAGILYLGFFMCMVIFLRRR